MIDELESFILVNALRYENKREIPTKRCLNLPRNKNDCVRSRKTKLYGRRKKKVAFLLNASNSSGLGNYRKATVNFGKANKTCLHLPHAIFVVIKACV